MTSGDDSPIHARRTFLLGAGATVLVACSGDDATPAAPSSSSVNTSTTPTTTTATLGDSPGPAALDPLTPEMFASIAVCALTPSAAAGPFPNREELDRHDVTEGYPGEPVRLGVRVVDSDCLPVPGARVEIWHADASGDYSSYADGGSGKDEAEGTTFLRGVRTADRDGIVEFQTIYPGWYEGRAVHIHARVWLEGVSTLTTQLYFDEAYTEAILASGPYLPFGPPDTGWADDALIGDPASDGTGIILTPGATSLGDGTVGLVNLGVAV